MKRAGATPKWMDGERAEEEAVADLLAPKRHAERDELPAGCGYRDLGQRRAARPVPDGDEPGLRDCDAQCTETGQAI